MEEIRRKILLQGDDTETHGMSHYGLFSSLRTPKSLSKPHGGDDAYDPFGAGNAHALGGSGGVGGGLNESTHSMSSHQSEYSGGTPIASVTGTGTGTRAGVGVDVVSALHGTAFEAVRYGGHSTDKAGQNTNKRNNEDSINDGNIKNPDHNSNINTNKDKVIDKERNKSRIKNNSSLSMAEIDLNSLDNDTGNNYNNRNGSINNNTNNSSSSSSSSSSMNASSSHIGRDRDREKNHADLRGKVIKSGDLCI